MFEMEQKKLIEFTEIITKLPNSKLVESEIFYNEAGNLEITGTIVQVFTDVTIKNFREILDINRGQNKIRPIECLFIDGITIDKKTFESLKKLKEV